MGRVSTPTCAASLVSAASQSREALPSRTIFSYLKPTFRISVLTPVGCFGGSRPTGPVLELFRKSGAVRSSTQKTCTNIHVQKKNT